MAKPGPKSKMARLDPAILEQINRLLVDEGRTIDDVVEYLASLRLDDTPSRSSVVRWSVSTANMRGDMEKMRAVTKQLGKEFGAQDNDSVRFLMQIAQTIAFKIMNKQAGEDGGIEIEEFMLLMKGLKDLSTARKATLDAEEKILAKLKRDAAKLIDQAARDAIAAGEGKGLTPERLAQLRRDILGVRLKPT